MISTANKSTTDYRCCLHCGSELVAEAAASRICGKCGSRFALSTGLAPSVSQIREGCARIREGWGRTRGSTLQDREELTEDEDQ